jgi:hypothetical protein
VPDLFAPSLIDRDPLYCPPMTMLGKKDAFFNIKSKIASAK